MISDYQALIIRPRTSKLSVECRVFERHADMLGAIRKDMARGGRKGVGSNTAAFCATYKDSIPAGRFAVIYFCKKHLTIGTVAHEFIHATLALLARRRVKEIECTADWATEDEETLCQISGDLTDAFYKAYGI